MKAVVVDFQINHLLPSILQPRNGVYLFPDEESAVRWQLQILMQTRHIIERRDGAYGVSQVGRVATASSAAEALRRWQEGLLDSERFEVVDVNRGGPFATTAEPAACLATC